MEPSNQKSQVAQEYGLLLANAQQQLAESPVTKNVGLQIFESSSLQVCSLRLSHTAGVAV